MPRTPAKPKPTEPPPAEVKPVQTPTADQQAAADQMEDIAAKRPVIVKLARIMAAIGDLQPEGSNPHFGYSFIKDTQVSGALRGRLARERMMIIPEVLSEEWVEVPTKRGTSYVTKMKIMFTVIDGDSGDSVSGTGFGYGDDAGDKGANKAMTAAMKYWLLKTFQIGGEDAEADTHADERASDRIAGTPEVKVEGAQITGVARGGKSNKITKAQAGQLMALYKELEYSPTELVDAIDRHVGDNLVLDESEGADVSAQLNSFIKNMDADDAGKLITGMTDEKDARDEAAAGGGYG